MQRTVEKAFFALLRFEINGDELCDEIKNLITPEMLPALFKLSKRHDLAHLIGDALDKNELLPDGTEAKKRFLQERSMAVYRVEQLNYELESICRILEDNKIPHIPLKGSVLRKYYPKFWMRTSCDIDVLVKKEDLERATRALKSCGFTYKEMQSHDVQFWAESGVHIELHFDLIEESVAPKSAKTLSRAWERTNPCDGWKYRLEFDDEFFSLYHIAHMAKHFLNGGCGIRPFLDLWIMERKMPYDKEKLREMLKEGGLLAFYENANHLAGFWFAEIEPSDTVKAMEEYILRGGVYGTTENKVAVSREKLKNKFLFILSCIFLSHENLCQVYPSLKGKKWLTPFYQVRRWFRIIFKGASKNTSSTLRAYDSVSKERKQDVKNLLDDLGLCITDGKGF